MSKCDVGAWTGRRSNPKAHSYKRRRNLSPSDPSLVSNNIPRRLLSSDERSRRVGDGDVRSEVRGSNLGPLLVTFSRGRLAPAGGQEWDSEPVGRVRGGPCKGRRDSSCHRRWVTSHDLATTLQNTPVPMAAILWGPEGKAREARPQVTAVGRFVTVHSQLALGRPVMTAVRGHLEAVTTCDPKAQLVGTERGNQCHFLSLR